MIQRYRTAMCGCGDWCPPEGPLPDDISGGEWVTYADYLADKEADKVEPVVLLREIVNNTDAGYDVLAFAAIDDARMYLKQVDAQEGI